MTLLACGGGDDGPTFIDAGGGGGDGGQKACTTATAIGAQLPLDVLDEYKDSSIRFITDLGDVGGDPLILYMSFYHSSLTPSIPTSYDPSATFDMLTPSAGQNPPMQMADGTPDGSNLKTCAYTGVCIYALQFSPDFSAVNGYYMAKSGSITFTADPITSRNLDMTTSNLKLAELTVDENTGLSQFNPAGDCQSLSLPIAHTNVPNNWTCDAAQWYSGEPTSDCDCSCGVYDPDCYGPGDTTGCDAAGLPVCWPKDDGTTECLAALANDQCSGAEQLATPTTGSPTTTTGTTVAGHGDYNKGLDADTCTMYGQPGPDVTYKISLTKDVPYHFTLSDLAADADMSLSIVGPGMAALCDADIAECVAGADVGYDGENEELDFTPATTGTYFIIVDSYYRDVAGSFTLTATKP